MAGNIIHPEWDHKKAECHDPDCNGSCPRCTLFVCEKCGGFEGGLPDDCPGHPLAAETTDAIYAGILNYREGKWRCEPPYWIRMQQKAKYDKEVKHLTQDDDEE